MKVQPAGERAYHVPHRDNRCCRSLFWGLSLLFTCVLKSIPTLASFLSQNPVVQRGQFKFGVVFKISFRTSLKCNISWRYWATYTIQQPTWYVCVCVCGEGVV